MKATLYSFFFILLSILSACSKKSVTSIKESDCIEYTSKDLSFLDVYKLTTDIDIYELCSSNIKKFDKYTEDSVGVYKILLDTIEVYYPITISQAAVTFYKNYKETNNEEVLNKFLTLSSWLKNNFKDHGNYGLWVCENDYSGYDLKAPWSSAMAQGFGLMAMYEAYIVTKDSSFLLIAEKALNAYEIDVQNGGFTNKISKDQYQYEEYPTTPTSEILNGFIFSLSGLIDYHEATGSKKALSLFNKGINYLENNICYYTLPFTSRYNLYEKNPQLANAIGSAPGDGYHHLHIQQLSWLYLKTKKQVFAYAALDYLEKDLGSFADNYNISPKIKDISSNYCIDCATHGPSNLNDGNWTYGNYWSSNKNADLVINLGERKENIKAISLFLTDSIVKALSINLLIPDKQDSTTWVTTYQIPFDSNHDSYSKYEFETGKYNTYVYTFPITSFDTQKIKITFNKNKSLDYFALREIDFQYDRRKDLEKVFQKLCE